MANDIKLANEQTKAHWDTIQQWRIDEGKNFARSRSDAIARMSASGRREGSDQWNANLQSIEAAHAKELERQGQSATMGILDKWTKDMKDFYIKATETTLEPRHRRAYAEGDISMPQKERAPSGRGKNADPGFSYADSYAKWERMGRRERMENNMQKAPPKSYEEAVERSVQSGDFYRRKSDEGRALEDAGEENVFQRSGLSEDEFRNLTAEQFMELQFGYSEATNKSSEQAASSAASAKADDKRRAGVERQTQRESPWWG